MEGGIESCRNTCLVVGGEGLGGACACDCVDIRVAGRVDRRKNQHESKRDERLLRGVRVKIKEWQEKSNSRVIVSVPDSFFLK